MNNKRRRIAILAYSSLALLAVFILRLWQLQVLKGDYYNKESKKNRVRVIKIPASRGIIFDRNGTALVKNAPYYIASLIPDLSGEAVNLTRLAALLDLSVEDLSEKIINKRKHNLEPVRLKEGLSYEDVVRLEAVRSDFPGLIIETEITREYPYGTTAAHLVGYLSLPRKDQLRKGLFSNVPAGTFVGQWGVEAFYDERLRGKAGKRFVEVDALGRHLRTLRTEAPQRGESITLSLDIKAQIAAEKAFRKRSGALVAVDPSNGELLAHVSLPSFDPNLFSRGIAEKPWERLQSHPGHPMINRALQSQYPPGSIFKIVTAVAALEEGITDGKRNIECTGKIFVGPWKFSCWKDDGHGRVSLKRALIESCDVYFYEIGRLLGIDRIAKYANVLGLGTKSGLKLTSEKSGLIPDTRWKYETKGIPWYLGETFNAAIGQGYVSVTPVQASLMIAAIANGGSVFKPQLTKRGPAEDPASRIVLKPETVQLIRESLLGVVSNPKGTGWRARSASVEIAGKTGTAQVVKISDTEKTSTDRSHRDHAWFVAYAPAGRPQIALSVFVEHGGHGGSAAAPIAKKTIEEYLRIDNQRVQIDK